MEPSVESHQYVQPYTTAGSNAHNQISPGPTAACVKPCLLENTLTMHGILPKPYVRSTIWLLRQGI